MTALSPAHEEAALSYLKRRGRRRAVWEPLALCKQIGSRLFYPELIEGTTHKESPDEAKRVCRICPVMAECLAYALDAKERDGVWGGMSEKTRRQVLKRPHLARQALLDALNGEPPTARRKTRKAKAADRAGPDEGELRAA